MTGSIERTQPDPPNAVFAEDYLHFFGSELAARADRDAALIAAILNLPPGARLLDLCCGQGRIAQRLAAEGFQLDGIDISPTLVTAAKTAAARAGQHVNFAVADAADLPYARAEFAAVYCWFTSFGLAEDEILRGILAEAARVTAPGGRFVIELNNRDYLLIGFQRTDFRLHGDDCLFDRREFDITTGKLWFERTVRRAGRLVTRRFFLRQFTPPEITDWLIRAGFARVQLLGGDARPFDGTATEMIVVAER